MQTINTFEAKGLLGLIFLHQGFQLFSKNQEIHSILVVRMLRIYFLLQKKQKHRQDFRK
jgi:hypothetical protein